MFLTNFQKEQIRKELKIRSSRSSGPGGQHVNKVNSRIELRLHLGHSIAFDENQKQRIRQKLKNRITTGDELFVVAETERSQWKNKQKAEVKLFQLLTNALKQEKKRIRTKPTTASRKRRLVNKKLNSLKKGLRKPLQLP